jgi:hypothetical protein
MTKLLISGILAARCLPEERPLMLLRAAVRRLRRRGRRRGLRLTGIACLWTRTATASATTCITATPTPAPSDMATGPASSMRTATGSATTGTAVCRRGTADGVCDNIGLHGGSGNGGGAGYVDADGDGVCDNAGTNCLYGGVAPRDGTGRQFGGGNCRGRS